MGAFARFLDGVEGVLCEGFEVVVGGGEVSGCEIGQRREGAVVLAAFGVGGLDDAVHDDLDFAVRLFDGEQVRNIAVGVDLLQAAAGGADGPVKGALTQVAARGQVQALHAVLDGALVAVTCFVPNVHLHGFTPLLGVAKSRTRCGRRDLSSGQGIARETAAGRWR